MRKVISTLNMTLDGYCDHTVMVADETLHQHFTSLIKDAGALLYGRITYELMESHWPAVVRKPTGVKSADDFAVAIENCPKIVFSKTLKNLAWKNVRLAKQGLKEEVLELRKQPGKDIFVGSRSLIVALTNLGLVDEYQLVVHPIIAGHGLQLFKDITDKTILKLLKTKTLGSGQLAVSYAPKKE